MPTIDIIFYTIIGSILFALLLTAIIALFTGELELAYCIPRFYCYLKEVKFNKRKDGIIISFKQFQDFYNLNKCRYKLCDTLDIKYKMKSSWIIRYYLTDERCSYEHLYLSSYRDYLEYFKWVKNNSKKKENEKNSKKMEKFLKLVQDDIAAVRSESKNELEKAQSMINSISSARTAINYDNSSRAAYYEAKVPSILSLDKEDCNEN